MRVYVYLAASGLSCAQTLQLGHVGLVAIWNVDLSSLTGGQTHVPCLARWSLNRWTTKGVPTC